MHMIIVNYSTNTHDIALKEKGSGTPHRDHALDLRRKFKRVSSFFLVVDFSINVYFVFHIQMNQMFKGVKINKFHYN